MALAVLSSPRLSEPEVEAIAKMANVSDEILRIIGNTRAWVKSYGVVANEESEDAAGPVDELDVASDREGRQAADGRSQRSGRAPAGGAQEAVVEALRRLLTRPFAAQTS